MRRYLPYLVPAGLMALAILIVVTRDEEPAFFGINLKEVRTGAHAVSRDHIEETFQRWAEEVQDDLPFEDSLGLTIMAAEARYLTMDLQIRLPYRDNFRARRVFRESLTSGTEELCQDPAIPRLLEAGMEVAAVFEDYDGNFMGNYLLNKQSCGG